jgi:hypothetical protein
LAVTDVSRQPIGPIFKVMNLEGSPETSSVTSQQDEGLINTAAKSNTTLVGARGASVRL